MNLSQQDECVDYLIYIQRHGLNHSYKVQPVAYRCMAPTVPHACNMSALDLSAVGILLKETDYNAKIFFEKNIFHRTTNLQYNTTLV